MIRITLPRDLPVDDYPRLRAHAHWYLRQVARFGPAYGARRFARAARARGRADAHAGSACAGPR